jgi:hypothetical protein
MAAPDRRARNAAARRADAALEAARSNASSTQPARPADAGVPPRPSASIPSRGGSVIANSQPSAVVARHARRRT